MDTAANLKLAEDLLKPWTIEMKQPEDIRLDVVIRPQDLKAATRALIDAHWGYLSAITGLDKPVEKTAQGDEGVGKDVFAEDFLEVLYHFCYGAAVTTLRVSVPYSAANLDSVCEIIPSATLYERELMEMFGVEIKGTPSHEKLLLADDWPDGVYPLRKSFTGFKKE
jgi:NADH:ubiquinone oxidoreductase subunit C